MEAALKAIAEPRRRQILTLVRNEELSAGEIAAHFDVTRPAISQHLTVLKEAGLVSERRDGTRRLYLARAEGLEELRAFLEGFWDDGWNASGARPNERSARSMDATTEGIAVEREIAIDASPETVWELLTDPAQATKWMGTSAELDVRPGGLYRVEVIPGNVARGEFVVVDAPRRLVHTWGWEPGARSIVEPGQTTIEYELVPTATGTLLRFSHRDLPSEESAASHGQGWDHYLGRLAVAAAGGAPGVDPWTTEMSGN